MSFLHKIYKKIYIYLSKKYGFLVIFLLSPSTMSIIPGLIVKWRNVALLAFNTPAQSCLTCHYHTTKKLIRKVHRIHRPISIKSQRTRSSLGIRSLISSTPIVFQPSGKPPKRASLMFHSSVGRSIKE